MPTKRQPQPTAEIGSWQPDRTAPILLDGQPIGTLIQLYGWFDIEYATGLRWGGGKTLPKALAVAANVYQTHPGARPGGACALAA